MIRSNVHETRIAPQVVDAIRIGARNVGRGKVVPVYFDRLLCRKPLSTAIIIVSEQFFLLGVHRYHRRPRRQSPLHLCADVTELRVAVRMVSTFFRLAIAELVVCLRAHKLRHLLMADRMLLPCQLSGQIPCALAYPTQGRFRDTPRVWFRSEEHTSELQSLRH